MNEIIEIPPSLASFKDAFDEYQAKLRTYNLEINAILRQKIENDLSTPFFLGGNFFTSLSTSIGRYARPGIRTAIITGNSPDRDSLGEIQSTDPVMQQLADLVSRVDNAQRGVSPQNIVTMLEQCTISIKNEAIVCSSAEPRFMKMIRKIDEALVSNDFDKKSPHSSGAFIFHTSGEPVAIQKVGVGEPTLLTLNDIAVGGFCAPAGSLIEFNKPPVQFNPHRPIRVVNLDTMSRKPKVHFLRQSAFVFNAETRDELFNDGFSFDIKDNKDETLLFSLNLQDLREILKDFIGATG